MTRTPKRIADAAAQAFPAPLPSAGPLTGDQVLDTVSRAGLIFFEWSPSGGITHVSDSVREFTGYSPDEFDRDPRLSERIMHPDTRAALEAFGMELMETHPPNAETEIRLVAKDGRDLWLECRMVPLYGEKGEVRAVRGVAIDVTSQVQAREAASEAEERYRRIFEDAPVPLWLVDPDSREVLEANTQACKLYGYLFGELEGKRFEDLFRADEWAAVEAPLMKPVADHKLEVIARVMQRRKDGSSFPAQVSVGSVRVGGRKRRLAFIRDLTDVEESRDRLAVKRRALDTAAEPVLILDRTARVAFSNRSAEALLVRTPEELAGQDPAELGQSEAWAEQWRGAIEVALLGDRWSGPMSFKGPGGGAVEVTAEFEPVSGDGDEVTHIIVRFKGGARMANDTVEDSVVFLDLLRLHIEDLLDAARRQLGAGSAAASGTEAVRRHNASLLAVETAAGIFRLFGDLSGAEGPAMPIDASAAGEDINDVVGEAVTRLRPVFASRDVAVFRRSLTTGPCAHPAIAREVLIQLLFLAARGVENGALKIEVIVEAAPDASRPAVTVTLKGPRPAGAEEPSGQRLELAKRALEAIGGALETAEAPTEGSPHHARFVVTLPRPESA